MRLPLFACLFSLPFLLPGFGQDTGTAKKQSEPASKAEALGTAPQAELFVAIPGMQEFTGEVIVRPLQRYSMMSAGRSLEEANRVASMARKMVLAYEPLEYVPQTDEYILAVPEGQNESSLAHLLLRTGLFQYVEPNWLLAPSSVIPPAASPQGGPQTHLSLPQTGCPNDLRFPDQWHHRTSYLRSCAAWLLETGGPQISVGVCDTGIRTTHEDLLLNRLEAYNAVDRLWEFQGGAIGPRHYHGTRTTGVVAANGNNGVGVAGVGWNLSHRMLRVSNLSNGGAQLATLQHAARISIESGDRVANTSYHGVAHSSNITTAAYIESIGGIWVWGAGNTGGNHTLGLRDDDALIVVGASIPSEQLWSSSSSGVFMDLVAPGVGIWTTDSGFDQDYESPSGTSYASPMVSAVCAMIWSQRPQLAPSDVQSILKTTCVDLGVPGVDPEFGYGRIDLLAALMEDGSDVPVSEFAAPVTVGRSPLSVAFRSLATGVATSWLWDFGDGNTSTDPNPVHVYSSLGTYDVTLTVQNSLGSDSVTKLGYVLVDVIPPVADFEHDPEAGLSPISVQFTDLSTGGVPASWLWDFGDGNTSTQQNPQHVYTAAGFYTVGLTVSNAYGSDTLQVQSAIAVDFIPPVSDFQATPTSGNSPLVVQFTDLSAGGTATEWVWSFGDGSGSTVQHPSHVYTSQGTYTVRLTASNVWGAHLHEKVGFIQVGVGPSMLPDFVGTPLTGSAPLQVSFQDLSIGNPNGWTWEFDDGTTSNLQNPVHVFLLPGEYNVALEIVNAAGDDESIEKEAYIVVQ